MFANLGITKRALADYYLDVADEMLPAIRGRPLTIVRCPRGEGRQCFYQKHFAEDGDLDGLEVLRIREAQGFGSYAAIAGAAGLVQLVQLGTLELHHWLARSDRLECPDQMILDLDPGSGVGWARLRRAAREARARLAELGLESFVRTTGSKGLHVVAPLEPRHSWEQVRRAAKGVADAMAADSPGQFVATAAKGLRAGKIYVDYLRNARGATAIASYSTRARPGAPVATPLGWHELARVSSGDHYRIGNVRARLGRRKEPPWPDFDALRQRLPA
jgi:bifunctional non-homologous end joining protein LigD